MDLGIGLPSAIPGNTPEQIFTWARRADRAGFSTLGMLDRLVYGNDESLVSLGAAAALTERIRLAAILVAPYRNNAALLAKQVATVDRLSGGRTYVAATVGGREDDFTVSGAPYANRGATLERIVDQMRRIWSDEGADQIGPKPAQRHVPLLIGGSVDRALRRAASHGDGWISGGEPPPLFAVSAGKVRAAWAEHGREGRPRLVACAYFALGPGAAEQAAPYLLDYYAFMGPAAALVAGSVLTDAPSLRAAVHRYEEAGCDELILMPCLSDPDQVDRLAEATAVAAMATR